MRAGLVVPSEHLPLLAAGVDVRPRYRVTDPDTGELVERTPQVRRVPAVSSSTRVLSVAQLDRNARRVARQARAAAAHGRLVELVAAFGCYAARVRPAGAGRGDARRNAAVVLAAAGAVADFGTGRYARPGRQDTAAQAGVTEQTVRRHWRTLERLGLLQLVVRGRWLSAGERAEIEADPDQRDRWRDRQEWTLTIPEWVREITDAGLAPWLDWARGVVAQIIDPDTPADQAPPASSRNRGNVPPPSGIDLAVYLPVVRTKFSQDAATARRRRRSRTRPPNRPGGRAEEGAASRPSPTRTRRAGNGRAMPPEAAALARQLIASGRIPWLAAAPRYMLAAALQQLAGRGWTADDVHEHVERTVRDRGWSIPQWVIAPVAYLARLLRGADPDRPPASTRRAAERARREQQLVHQAQQRAERAQRAEQAVPGRDHAELQQARAQLRTTSIRSTPPAPTAPTSARVAIPSATAGRSAAIHAAALDRARREKRERRLRGSSRPGGID